MATRKEIIVLIILVLLIVLLVKLAEFYKTNVVEADASKFVFEDLHSKYPNADIEIMSMRDGYNDAGEKYFEIKTKVTEGAFTPCPERMHIYYNYPVQNFVSQPTEYITSNCRVCTGGTCTIAFPEEAIIASHTFAGTEAVHAFVTESEAAYPSVVEGSDRWTITWDSPVSTHYYAVIVGKEGTLVSAEDIQKK
ncbi:hypothetical protein H0O02_01530 [Candidatus Micrarchaeota archaeon]|nr:hypothetical protein [Candidatus Micrarchaeota archaeon]